MIRCRLRRFVTSLLFAILAVLLIKTVFNIRQLLKIKFNFTENKELGEEKGQSLVDYIALNLVIEYVNDGYEGNKVFISMKNNGSKTIPGDKWSIVFSHADGFHDVARQKFKLIEKSRVIMRHLDGWLFSVEPLSTGIINTSFTPLQPNQTLIIHEKATLKSQSYAFPNWYVCGDGLRPRIVLSTLSRRPRLSSRGRKWSSKSRFDRNEVVDLHRSVKSIIPTPLSVRNNSGDMRIDRNWKVAYHDDFEKEATYLAERLQLTSVKSADSEVNAINLVMKNLSLHLTTLSQTKRLNADEGYMIKIEKNTISISGQTSHGIFYGIQSLLSLLENSEDGQNLPLLEIIDAPRFVFRGFMYDAARNFIRKTEVLKTIELMAMYKLNKLHLHLTDDQGWRLEIPTLPELTEIGSVRNHDLKEEKSLLPYYGSRPINDPLERHYYSVEDYKDILNHAKVHHVEVIPEFDMPGHSHAAVQSMRMRYARMKQRGSSEEMARQFLLHDFNDTSWYLGVNEQKDSVINPCIESAYTFVKELIRSVVSLHQDIQPLKTIHLGGDEVPHGALVKSPACSALTTKMPELIGNLKLYFMKRIINIANEFGLRVQTWEDGLSYSSDVPVNVGEWKNKAGVGINAWKLSEAAYTFANQGYEVILTHAHKLYLDHPNEPDNEEMGLYWAATYIDSRIIFNFMFAGDLINQTGQHFSQQETCRILDIKNCHKLQSPENIIGMQSSLWGEMIRSNEDFEYMLCPRLLAFAERAWHMADWETADNEKDMKDLRRADWGDFANTLGYKELRRLDSLGIKYRIPLPGVRIKGTMVDANIEFPGLNLQYSQDDGKTWSEYSEGRSLEKTEHLSFSAVSHDLKRRGRVVNV